MPPLTEIPRIICNTLTSIRKTSLRAIEHEQVYHSTSVNPSHKPHSQNRGPRHLRVRSLSNFIATKHAISPFHTSLIHRTAMMQSLPRSRGKVRSTHSIPWNVIFPKDRKEAWKTRLSSNHNIDHQAIFTTPASLSTQSTTLLSASPKASVGAQAHKNPLDLRTCMREAQTSCCNSQRSARLQATSSVSARRPLFPRWVRTSYGPSAHD